MHPVCRKGDSEHRHCTALIPARTPEITVKLMFSGLSNPHSQTRHRGWIQKFRMSTWRARNASFVMGVWGLWSGSQRQSSTKLKAFNHQTPKGRSKLPVLVILSRTKVQWPTAGFYRQLFQQSSKTIEQVPSHLCRVPGRMAPSPFGYITLYSC